VRRAWYDNGHIFDSMALSGFGGSRTVSQAWCSLHSGHPHRPRQELNLLKPHAEIWEMGRSWRSIACLFHLFFLAGGGVDLKVNGKLAIRYQ
jgi:hypothetical protein